MGIDTALDLEEADELESSRGEALREEEREPREGREGAKTDVEVGGAGARAALAGVARRAAGNGARAAARRSKRGAPDGMAACRGKRAGASPESRRPRAPSGGDRASKKSP